MLAIEELDPTPYAKQLKPLIEHWDERVKQGAARFLKAIKEATAPAQQVRPVLLANPFC